MPIMRSKSRHCQYRVAGHQAGKPRCSTLSSHSGPGVKDEILPGGTAALLARQGGPGCSQASPCTRRIKGPGLELRVKWSMVRCMYGVSPSAITLRRGPGQGAGRVANQQSRSTVSTHDPAIKRWSEIGVTACGGSEDMSHGPGARKALARLAVSGWFTAWARTARLRAPRGLV